MPKELLAGSLAEKQIFVGDRNIDITVVFRPEEVYEIKIFLSLDNEFGNFKNRNLM